MATGHKSSPWASCWTVWRTRDAAAALAAVAVHRRSWPFSCLAKGGGRWAEVCDSAWYPSQELDGWLH